MLHIHPYPLIFLNIELTKQSATVIILCAFGVHQIKEVTRSQLQSAMRLYCTDAEQKKNLSNLSKEDFILPLASLLLKESIVGIKEGADIRVLNRDDVTKEKPF